MQHDFKRFVEDGGYTDGTKVIQSVTLIKIKGLFEDKDKPRSEMLWSDGSTL
jgi:hypothetical protein